jgi:uncharacterized repeat protein (TIGR03803 family)
MTTMEKPWKASPLSVGRVAAFFVALIAAAEGGASTAAAQTETILHSFAGGTSDGANSYASLTIDASGNLYGTTLAGGSLGQGVVFEIASGGTYSILSSLPGGSGGVNGAGPCSAPVLDGSGNLYGTAANNTYSGGVYSGNGVVYKLTPNGTGGYTYSVLHTFAGSSEGANPFAGVIPDSTFSNLYGTTYAGGSASNDGIVYKEPVSGGTPTILHPFAGGSSDGANPYAGVILDSAGSNLYGTTVLGGSASNSGVVFKLSTGGGTPTYPHTFTTNSLGTDPRGGVIFDSAGNLYGATWVGGNVAGDGVVFKLTSNGIGGYTYSVLHTFAGGSSDGANPTAGLTMDSSGNLYGMTYSGGASGYGIVFEISSGGTYTVLHSFAGGASDGANPYNGLAIDSSGNLYGTTVNGGASGKGVVFKLVP